MKKPNIQWNLTHLCKNDKEAQKPDEFEEIRHAYKEFADKWNQNDKYLSDPNELRQALHEYELLEEKYLSVGKTGYYWILRKVQDQRDPLVKEMYAKTLNFDSEMHTLIQFFELNLAKVAPKQQQLFLSDKSLTPYKHFLEKLFEISKYTLSEKEEKIIHLKSQVAYDKWVEMCEEFLGKAKRRVMTAKDKIETKTFDEILSLLSSKNQRIRDIAASRVNDVLKRYAALAEHELNAILLNKKIDDELRGMQRPDLSRHLDDDIESSVVDTLRESVTKNFDIVHKYYRLKASLLKKKQLMYYERMVQFGNIKGGYTYDQAVKVVQKTFDDLDPEFGKHFKNFVSNGLIDPMPKVGKKGGAACYSPQKLLPSYIYLNFAGELRDVQTIAHEAGHAMHYEYSKKQSAFYYGSSKATAEVASTFMEDLVLAQVSKKLDDKSKLALLISQLDEQIAGIFRQIALYNFELELHTTFRKKQYLTEKEIGELFLKHMSSYMGDAVEMSKGSENWWVYWSHIRLFFYVYSYAGGLLIAKAMHAKIKEDKKFVEKVKEFFSAGQSLPVKDIFANMGIDVTKAEFWETGLQEIRETVETAEKLAKKLKLIK